MSPKVQQVTRIDILRAAKKFKRSRAAKWTTIVEGVELPARPLVLAAADANPMDPTNSHEAVRKLKELGFPVRYDGTPA